MVPIYLNNFKYQIGKVCLPEDIFVLYFISLLSVKELCVSPSQLSRHLDLNYLPRKEAVVISSDWDQCQKRFNSRITKFLGENAGCFVVVGQTH